MSKSCMDEGPLMVTELSLEEQGIISRLELRTSGCQNGETVSCAVFIGCLLTVEGSGVWWGGEHVLRNDRKPLKIPTH